MAEGIMQDENKAGSQHLPKNNNSSSKMGKEDILKHLLFYLM